MASWRSSSERSCRSTTPTSPTRPLSPRALPQWLRSGGVTSAVIPPGKYKILLIALGCIILGWSMTSMLTYKVHDISDRPFDGGHAASPGIFNDPSRSGTGTTMSVEYSGVTPPTIKSALGDLHKAVSDKITSWTLHGPPSSSEGQDKSAVQDSDSYNISANALGEHIKEGQNETESLGARTRVGKCTILFGGNGLWERALKTHEAHDRMHGYRLHVLRQHLLDDVWSKPAYILSILLREMAKPEHERLEWLLWVDADTIILNPYIPIESFLPPAGEDFEHVHLLYTNDWNGLNNGVFPVRVNTWAVELFSAIISYRYYRPEGDLRFRDQSAMNTLMSEPRFAKNIMAVPQRWFNAYLGEQSETLAPYQIRRGDFLVHFAGYIQRDPIMKIWVDRAEQHLDDWEMPLKSTSYPQEIKDFWNEQRDTRQGLKNDLGAARYAASESLTRISTMMKDFSDRLPTAEIEIIRQSQEAMRNFLGDSDQAENLARLGELQGQLDEAVRPLQALKADNHKLMLASAHDAIFAAEKDLLDSGFHRGISNPENIELNNAIKHLKDYVLTSEDLWNRQEMMAAVDSLVAARNRLSEKTAELEAGIATSNKAGVGTRRKSAVMVSTIQPQSSAWKIAENGRLVAGPGIDDSDGGGTIDSH